MENNAIPPILEEDSQPLKDPAAFLLSSRGLYLIERAFRHFVETSEPTSDAEDMRLVVNGLFAREVVGIVANNCFESSF